MRRGKVEMKVVEKESNRQVTFTKRRRGLVKKAHEISVLCAADVALIVFSHRGKLFEFSSSASSVEKILGRYEKYAYAKGQIEAYDYGLTVKETLEYSRLMSNLELLQKTHRHHMGEDLDMLSLKDLDLLQQQLDTAIKQVRSRKNQLMNESLSELRKQGNAIQEENDKLAKKIIELSSSQGENLVINLNHGPKSSAILPNHLSSLNNRDQANATQVGRNQLQHTPEPICNTFHSFLLQE